MERVRWIAGSQLLVISVLVAERPKVLRMRGKRRYRSGEKPLIRLRN